MSPPAFKLSSCLRAPVPHRGAEGGAQGLALVVLQPGWGGGDPTVGVVGTPRGPCAPAPPVPTEHIGLGLAEHGGCRRHHWRAGGCGAARPGRQPPQRQALLGPQICKKPLCPAQDGGELGFTIAAWWARAASALRMGPSGLGSCPRCPLPLWQHPLPLPCSSPAVLWDRAGLLGPPAQLSPRWSRSAEELSCPPPCPEPPLAHSPSIKLI